MYCYAIFIRLFVKFLFFFLGEKLYPYIVSKACALTSCISSWNNRNAVNCMCELLKWNSVQKVPCSWGCNSSNGLVKPKNFRTWEMGLNLWPFLRLQAATPKIPFIIAENINFTEVHPPSQRKKSRFFFTSSLKKNLQLFLHYNRASKKSKRQCCYSIVMFIELAFHFQSGLIGFFVNSNNFFCQQIQKS